MSNSESYEGDGATERG
jgi:hypothetical protein